MADEIHLAEYIFTRLRQVGVESIHGVPGDYNLTALDYIEPAGIHWIGNANELVAGYSADGYGRIKGISAMVTVIGVGELSAINAMAGSYAERSPVVYVVGTPPTAAQNNKVNLHHTLGDGNYRVFAEMAAKVTCAQANLLDPTTAPVAVDRLIRECIIQHRPVYLELPTDMVVAKVPASRLQTPIDTSIHYPDSDFHEAEVEEILSRIYASKQPLIIVDGFVRAYGIQDEADELVRVLGFPTSTTPFGKGTVNETYRNFHGVYAGVAGKQVYVSWVQTCDLILRLGPLNSDVNTFGFTTIPPASKTITFNRDSVEICNTEPTWPQQPKTYANLHVKSLLRHLLSKIDKSRLPKYDPYPTHLGNGRDLLAALPPTKSNALIDQDTFYQRISTIFQPHDIILTETGTMSVGSRDMVLPPHATLINSSLWLSIGYMLPAACGAAIAQRELQASSSSSTNGTNGTTTPASPDPRAGRTILFEGDGSLQMTAQSISDMIRNHVPITIFIVNNDGYTIERWIHGMRAAYNDVPMWRYTDAARFMGYGSAHLDHLGGSYGATDQKAYPLFTATARNWGELWDVLGSEGFKDRKGMKLVEVVMEKEDAPETLKVLVRGAAERNQPSSAKGKKKVNGTEEKREEEGKEDQKERQERVNEEVVERVVSAAG